MQFFELQAKLAVFFLMKHHIYLKEWLSDKLFFRTGYLTDILQSKESLSLQGNKKLTVFLVIKFEPSSENCNFEKHVSNTLA